MSNTTRVRGFEVVAPEYLKSHDKTEDVILPLRGTAKSAGYDFFLPEDIEILPQSFVLVWTDVKAYMQPNEVLELYPRSSAGIKNDIMIKNTVGIVDMDYYSNERDDGNIRLYLWNFGDRNRCFNKGDAIAQGIFKPFLESDNCNTDTKRVGGVGSTDKTIKGA